MNLYEILVIDIETASEFPSFHEMDSDWKELWSEKASKIKEDSNVSEMYQLRSGVMAEFSKIICISIGYVIGSKDLKFTIESFYGYNERKLIEKFILFLNEISNIKSKWFFAGHNIKEFDIPFICRRILKHGMNIPDCLNFQN
jgi:DNA polymerase elongation subunit (family B)